MKNYKVLYSIFSFFFLITVGYCSNAISSGNFSKDFTSCIVYNDEWYYGGYLGIPVSTDLIDDQEIIDEALFAAGLQQDLIKSEEIYNLLPDSLNGKIIDTDIARNLYVPYASSVDNRYHYVCSTLMPAAWFVDYLYYKRLMELAVENRKNEVCAANSGIVLLAGGDGSGKTSSVRQLGLSILEEADLIKDSTMSSDFEFHRDMVQETLDFGLNVTVVYVFRPIELALEGNIKRAEIVGRVRPLVEIVEAHYKAQQNVLQLSEYFNSKINVIVIDNSRSFDEVRLVEDGIEFLRSPEVLYESQETVLERALIAYSHLDKTQISDKIKDLLERKLDPSVIPEEIQNSQPENQRWVNYLKKFISAIAEKIGFK